MALLAKPARTGGYLHCATDWQPYAEQMLEVLGRAAARQPLRRLRAAPRLPPADQFENRGLRWATACGDLVFTLNAQVTQPKCAVTSTSTPKAMRYQAKGVKVWLEM